MLYYRGLIVLCALCGLAVSAPADAAPTWSEITGASWNLIATRNHDAAGEVKVYKADIGDMPCFKGVAESEVPKESMFGVISDIPAATKWSTAGVREAEVLGKGSGWIEYYQYLDVPGWTMASDRFWFLHGEFTTNANSIVFQWNRLENGGDHKARLDEVVTANPNAIEPPVNVGGWTFEDAGSGSRATYFVCSDVGGVLPTSIQNAATKKTLPDTVGDVIREARSRLGK